MIRISFFFILFTLYVFDIFGQIKAEEENFQKTNQDYTDWQIKTGYISTLITPLTYLAVNVTLIVVIWQGQIAISHHYLTKSTNNTTSF